MKYKLIHFLYEDLTEKNVAGPEDSPSETFHNLEDLRAWIATHLEEIRAAACTVAEANKGIQAIGEQFGVQTKSAFVEIHVGVKLTYTNHTMIHSETREPAVFTDTVRRLIVSGEGIYIPGYEGPEWTIQLVEEACTGEPV